MKLLVVVDRNGSKKSLSRFLIVSRVRVRPIRRSVAVMTTAFTQETFSSGKCGARFNRPEHYRNLHCGSVRVADYSTKIKMMRISRVDAVRHFIQNIWPFHGFSTIQDVVMWMMWVQTEIKIWMSLRNRQVHESLADLYHSSEVHMLAILLSFLLTAYFYESPLFRGL
jgi:hypothetical protein